MTIVSPPDYKVLFEKSAGPYLVLDPDLRMVAASDAYCRATLTRREDMLGRPLFEVFPDNTARPEADGAGNLRASLDRVLRLKRADHMATQRYDLMRPPSAGGGFEERYWSPLNIPVLSDVGEVLWIIHRVRDVTEAVRDPETEAARRSLAGDQSRIINRLRVANEELAELDSLREGLLRMSRLNTIAMMASALAHDVSQPITAAKNYLSALRRVRARPDFDIARLDDMVERIGAQIDRAGTIIRDLRSVMTAANTVRQPESIAEVIGEAVKLVRGVLATFSAGVTVDVAPALPVVMMDRIQIQQVVVNLLTNAAQAMAGLEQRRIRVAARLDGGFIRVDVADTGIGLPDDVAKSLVEPFGATKLVGHGFGLPISRQIVVEHGGALTAAPNQPAGTVLSFTLPVV